MHATNSGAPNLSQVQHLHRQRFVVMSSARFTLDIHPDIASAVDLEVCRSSALFLGNVYSSFSFLVREAKLAAGEPERARPHTQCTEARRRAYPRCTADLWCTVCVVTGARGVLQSRRRRDARRPDARGGAPVGRAAARPQRDDEQGRPGVRSRLPLSLTRVWGRRAQTPDPRLLYARSVHVPRLWLQHDVAVAHSATDKPDVYRILEPHPRYASPAAF